MARLLMRSTASNPSMSYKSNATRKLCPQASLFCRHLWGRPLACLPTCLLWSQLPFTTTTAGNSSPFSCLLSNKLNLDQKCRHFHTPPMIKSTTSTRLHHIKPFSFASLPYPVYTSRTRCRQTLKTHCQSTLISYARGSSFGFPLAHVNVHIHIPQSATHS